MFKPIIWFQDQSHLRKCLFFFFCFSLAAFSFHMLIALSCRVSLGEKKNAKLPSPNSPTEIPSYKAFVSCDPEVPENNVRSPTSHLLHRGCSCALCFATSFCLLCNVFGWGTFAFISKCLFFILKITCIHQKLPISSNPCTYCSHSLYLYPTPSL